MLTRNSAFGNSLSYVAPDGSKVASESLPFDGTLDTSEYEIAIFSDKECDQDCQYWRPNATSHCTSHSYGYSFQRSSTKSLQMAGPARQRPSSSSSKWTTIKIVAPTKVSSPMPQPGGFSMPPFLASYNMAATATIFPAHVGRPAAASSTPLKCSVMAKSEPNRRYTDRVISKEEIQTTSRDRLVRR